MARTRSPSGARPQVAGVGISSHTRVMFPTDGITKLDLARYYEGISEWMLPQVRGRPLTLLRCPREIGQDCAFMKHSKVWAPEALRRVRIQERTKQGEYLIADTPAALVALAQMDVIEIHTWNSRFERLEEPDRIVFDLDPGPEVGWGQVVEAARGMRAVLRELGLESFVKTTGGKGLHIVVPLIPGRWVARKSLHPRRCVASEVRVARRTFHTASVNRLPVQDDALREVA